MTKSRDSPIFGASRRSSRAHSAWNVDSHTPFASSPISAVDALAHLLRRLVGERDREHLIGLGMAVADEIGDAIGDDARLAGAGARRESAAARRDAAPPRVVQDSACRGSSWGKDVSIRDSGSAARRIGDRRSGSGSGSGIGRVELGSRSGSIRDSAHSSSSSDRDDRRDRAADRVQSGAARQLDRVISP